MNYYVYIHYTKDTNEPFYVGKGKGKRAFSKDGRNRYWKYKVSKHGYYVEIIKKNLSEKQSFNHEIYMIYFLKNIGVSLVNMTDGGEGVSGYIPTKETLKKISLKTKEEKNANYNFKIFNFVNDELNIIENTTQNKLSKKYNICHSGVSQLVNGKIKSFKGWRLSSTDKNIIKNRGRNNPYYNTNIYTFQNIDTTLIENMTQNDFCKKYNFNHSSISAICRGKRKMHNGWMCLSIIEKNNSISKEAKLKLSNKLSGELNPQYDKTIRIFSHKDGTVEKCTSSELRKKYNLGSHVSSIVKGKLPHHRGWSYLGDISN